MNGRLPHFGSKTDFRFVLRSCETELCRDESSKGRLGMEPRHRPLV